MQPVCDRHRVNVGCWETSLQRDPHGRWKPRESGDRDAANFGAPGREPEAEMPQLQPFSVIESLAGAAH